MGRCQLARHEYHTGRIPPLSTQNTEQDGRSMRRCDLSDDTDSHRGTALASYSLTRTAGRLRQYPTIFDDIV